MTAAGPRQPLDPGSVVEFGTGRRKWSELALVGDAAAAAAPVRLHRDETTVAVALSCYLRTGARGEGDVGGECVVAAIVSG